MIWEVSGENAVEKTTQVRMTKWLQPHSTRPWRDTTNT